MRGVFRLDKSALMNNQRCFRVMSFNANGIRSSISKGFFSWLSAQQADIVCVQETKAQASQLAVPEYHLSNYNAFFRDATVKKGYSGLAIYTSCQPDAVLTHLGWPDFDEEGRYLEVRFGQLSIVNFYIPSGSSGAERQAYKMKVLTLLRPILTQWLCSDRQYILCGDWNIVRTSLDIRNWRANQKNSGCLPVERDWINGICADEEGEVALEQGRGWVDTYRVLHPHGEAYTWWSQRGNARTNNVGWRIDYQLVSPSLRPALQACAIAREPRFSDHAPYCVDYAR